MNDNALTQCGYWLNQPKPRQKVWVRRYCKRRIHIDSGYCWQHKKR